MQMQIQIQIQMHMTGGGASRTRVYTEMIDKLGLNLPLSKLRLKRLCLLLFELSCCLLRNSWQAGRGRHTF